MNLHQESILRIFRDLAAEELSQSRGDRYIEETSQDWNRETAIRDRDENGNGNLGVDSLELLNLAARANEFFHLRDFGMSDSVLRGKTLGDWARLIDEAIQPDWEELTIRSSGTTGEPKTFRVRRDVLAEECAHWINVLGQVERFVSLVPAQHLYGLIWTALLPSAYAGAEQQVLEARWKAGNGWLDELRAGDVVVGFPYRYRMLTQCFPASRVPAGVTAVSSAGALGKAEWETLAELGFERVVEVYGASETGGVGWRGGPQESYTLTPYWVDRKDELSSLPDHIEWLEGNRFRLLCRKDGLVKVGGKLVDPAAVARLIESHEQVRECSVWREGNSEQDARLQALIVPAGELTGEREQQALAQQIRSWLAAQLPAAARPTRYSFGDEIPRTALGKQRLVGPRIAPEEVVQ